MTGIFPRLFTAVSFYCTLCRALTHNREDHLKHCYHSSFSLFGEWPDEGTGQYRIVHVIMHILCVLKIRNILVLIGCGYCPAQHHNHATLTQPLKFIFRYAFTTVQ